MPEAIEKYTFNGESPLEFEILDLGERLAQKHDMMTVPHRAQFHHIIWFNKGRGTHYVDFKPIEIEDHTLLFIPSNSVNLYDPEGIYDAKAIIFTDNFFCKNTPDTQFLKTTQLFSDLYDTAKIIINQQSSSLGVFLNAMEAEFQHKADQSQASILRHMLHIFLLKAEREMDSQGFVKLQPSAHLDTLIEFRDLLELNYKTEKAVNKYASKLNITEKLLHKATKTLLDKSPKQIIDERVLLEAKRQLSYSSYSVKEIAYDLGYDEPTNFIKYFKKRTNLTPTKFREQY